MEKPTKILLIGTIAALLVVGIGYGTSLKYKAHIFELVTQCESENERAALKYGPDSFESFPIDCDPEKIGRLSNPSPPLAGIRDEIGDAKHQEKIWFERAIYIAIGIFLLAAMPYAWYFFLRRVRELRDALTGN